MSDEAKKSPLGPGLKQKYLRTAQQPVWLEENGKGKEEGAMKSWSS